MQVTKENTKEQTTGANSACVLFAQIFSTDS